MPPETEMLFVTDIFDSIRYLRLTSNKNIFPTKVDQLEFLKDDIFILDKSLGMIFKFSNNGSLISVLNKIGQGPEEYQYLHRFIVDEKNKVIEIYDKIGQKIIQYDEDFNFLNSFKVNLFFENFVKIGDKKYLFYLAQENIFHSDLLNYNLVIWEDDSLSFSSILQKPTDSKFQNKAIYFDQNSDLVFLTQAFNDTIYSYNLEKNDIVNKISVDFSEKFIGEFNSLDEVDEFYFDGSYSTNIDYLYFNEKVISFNYIKNVNNKNFSMRYYYFPNSHKSFNSNRLYNDIDNFNLFRHYQFRKGEFVNIITPEFISMIDLEKTSKEFQNTVDTLTPFEDQIILIFLKLKDEL